MSKTAKMKKPWYKKVWVWIIVALVLIIGLASGEDAPEVEDTIPTTSVMEITEPAPETSEPTVDNEAIISTFVSLIDLHYPNYKYNIYVEDECFYIDIWQPNLANDLSTLIIYNQLDSWYTLVDATEFACGEMKALAETMGSEFNVIWTWYDEVNGKDTPFLTSFNDTVYFDMLKEIS